MKLLCIGGFLGSGKTTLLLRVARFMVSQSLKVVIVENEIGPVGGGWPRRWPVIVAGRSAVVVSAQSGETDAADGALH